MTPLPGPVAAIDCGTNSTRLLIAGPDGDPLIRLMRITRLGQGVDHSGRLAGDAIQRTLAVLREFAGVMGERGVAQVRMTATSAARDAGNRDDFFLPAADIVGVRPELLSGDEEGRLSFMGATADLDDALAPWLVADIGGGSTELIIGDSKRQPTAVCSLDVGCVRLTERYLGDDPPGPEQMAAARAHVADLLVGVDARQEAFRGGATLVGLAGTVAALAAIAQKLVTYDRGRIHHFSLTRAVVEGLLSALASEPAAARRRRPGVEPDRADVIVGGAVILAELMRHFGYEDCLTSEADILDGLVGTLLTP